MSTPKCLFATPVSNLMNFAYPWPLVSPTSICQPSHSGNSQFPVVSRGSYLFSDILPAPKVTGITGNHSSSSISAGTSRFGKTPRHLYRNQLVPTFLSSKIPSGVPPLAFSTLEKHKKNTPRPLNSFMTYRADHLQLIKDRHPGVSNKDISRIAGDMWKSEEPHIKDEYKRKAENLKAFHKRTYPDYKFAPRKKLKSATTGKSKSKSKSKYKNISQFKSIYTANIHTTQSSESSKLEGYRTLLGDMECMKLNDTESDVLTNNISPYFWCPEVGYYQNEGEQNISNVFDQTLTKTTQGWTDNCCDYQLIQCM